MGRKWLFAAVVLGLTTGTAFADPIAGRWRTEAGSAAEIAPCAGSYCITLKTGSHAGKMIGTLSAGGGGRYSGRITDPDSGKTYSGKASLAGDALKLSGCVLGGLICRSQTWRRL